MISPINLIICKFTLLLEVLKSLNKKPGKQFVPRLLVGSDILNFQGIKNQCIMYSTKRYYSIFQYSIVKRFLANFG